MKVHFVGIGGTGMGAVAGLLAQAGHDVRGSDTAVYPPMSEQLAALGVPVATPYGAGNLAWQPDVVVVGNTHGKDHVEVAAARDHGLTLTSFPAVLGEQFLRERHAIVVTGTHGKTTTTSMIGHVLVEAGRDPSLFVGGVPIGLGHGWRLGRGDDFVVEGDEYDTAFFDKGSKFLHYHPRSAVLTSIELDHVDIFTGLDAIVATFRRFVELIPADGLLVVAADSPSALAVAAQARCRVERYLVLDDGVDAPPADVTWWATSLEIRKSGRTAFDVYRGQERLDRFETVLVGRHNVANCLAAIAIAVGRGVPVAQVRRGIATFAGVRRRQELRGVAGGVTVLDDYAHHPTAVRETLRALRERFAKRRLVAVYEPRSATSRRSTFQAEFAEAFALADEVVIGGMYDPSKIPPAERFDPARLASDLRQAGTKASFVPEVADIASQLATSTGPGDVVVVLSSGSFDGLHDRLLDAIGDATRPARRGHMPEVRALLERCGLAGERASDDDFAPFFALSNERGIIGCVALEVLGEDAILRALAVDPEARGGGYGWMLADMAVAHARHRGARRIYLLTDSASDFFAAKLGFRVVDRSTTSAEVASSATFRASAGSTFVAMRLDL
ncbi:MAG: UDP-N-acetylmuramate--L-alanine ligase [Kofleriaceae bacterium]|nr:UDP-N-acetylmuramate--L-alanine ligase [Kofleriaceae bacterium]MBP6836590.1 UDP-N-acetylmuramate--L-alanine ligase [Kofleriaceae bacterium]MBP9207086.1 UDP-N-acetylmuramate--L-alanine ligase [Kofleriaceae bacterium]